MKIYAPVKDATGVWATVHFINGVGETDNPHLIHWFKTHGYKVEEEQIETVTTVETVETVEKPKPEFDLEVMTSDEIREWAKANGYGGIIKNTRNKEKLIELLNGVI